MGALELVTTASTAAIAVFTVLVGSWFATRVTTLEGRIDELESEQQYQWGRERQLIDYIYRAGLVPPQPFERMHK